MTDTAPFEGVEKRLVIQFAPEVIDFSESSSDVASTTVAAPKIRSPLLMSVEEWQTILDRANCSIVSVKELGDQKVYLLSESTLTVWKYGFLMKTCGRTTPFLALQEILSPLRRYLSQQQTSDAPEDVVEKDKTLVLSSTKSCDSVQMEEDASSDGGVSSSSPFVLNCIGDGVNWMTYSRLEFIHPEYQIYPHQSWTQEIDYLKTNLFVPQEGVSSSPFVQSKELPAGSNTLFLAFLSNGRAVHTPYNMREILMTGIDVKSVKNLTGYDSHAEKVRAETEAQPEPVNHMRGNIDGLNEKELDEFWFDPCGYSANALMRHSPHSHSFKHSTSPTDNEDDNVDYFSCHISPESETSYASLELGSRSPGYTSAMCGGFDLDNLIPHFTPNRLQLTQVTVGPSTAKHAEAASTPVASDDDAASYTTTASSSSGIDDFVRQQKPSPIQVSSLQDGRCVRFIQGAVECVVSHTGWQSEGC